MTDPIVYVLGGYQSSSIVLTDSGGINVPSGASYTNLKHDTDYDFSATINFETYGNSAIVEMKATVRFWAFDGEAGTAGSLLDEQLITVSPFGIPSLTQKVTSGTKFHSAAAGMRRNAVISLSNLTYTLNDGTHSDGFSCPYATDSSLVPDPTVNPAQSCSAWRNTESQVVINHHGVDCSLLLQRILDLVNILNYEMRRWNNIGPRPGSIAALEYVIEIYNREGREGGCLFATGLGTGILHHT
jgi:hypothetical protein